MHQSSLFFYLAFFEKSLKLDTASLKDPFRKNEDSQVSSHLKKQNYFFTLTIFVTSVPPSIEK